LNGGTGLKLPNGDHAVIEITKLTDYCLNPDHEHGSDKARVFAAALGLTQADVDWLRDRLLEAARDGEATLGRIDFWGERYKIDLTVSKDNRTATIRSGWIIRTGETIPRLTTCYILKEKKGG
jgi:uncharacterized protein DUF6883